MGVVAGHSAESAGVGVGRAVCSTTCDAAGDPPSGPQVARIKLRRTSERGSCKNEPPPFYWGHLARVPAVDQPSTTRLNSLFGLSFETVTALRGGHFAHRPCRDLVTAAALRPGT